MKLAVEPTFAKMFGLNIDRQWTKAGSLPIRTMGHIQLASDLSIKISFGLLVSVVAATTA